VTPAPNDVNMLKNAKMIRWRHCNVDNLKTLKANYMIIKLLCLYRMTKYVGKFCFEIPSNC